MWKPMALCMTGVVALAAATASAGERGNNTRMTIIGPQTGGSGVGEIQHQIDSNALRSTTEIERVVRPVPRRYSDAQVLIEPRIVEVDGHRVYGQHYGFPDNYNGDRRYFAFPTISEGTREEIQRTEIVTEPTTEIVNYGQNRRYLVNRLKTTETTTTERGPVLYELYPAGHLFRRGPGDDGDNEDEDEEGDDFPALNFNLYYYPYRDHFRGPDQVLIEPRIVEVESRTTNEVLGVQKLTPPDPVARYNSYIEVDGRIFTALINAADKSNSGRTLETMLGPGWIPAALD